MKTTQQNAEYKHKWYIEHRERILAKSNDKYSYDAERYLLARSLVINRLGGFCVKCGIKDSRILQLDHIYNGGKQDRQLNTKLAKMYGYLEMSNLTEVIQLLCLNCHRIKTLESGLLSIGRGKVY